MGLGNPTEPSIMMDPKNPNILVAGSNLNFYYTSSDGGATWESGGMTSPYGVWGDPAIEVDTSGNFYFFHLSSPPEGEGEHIDRIVCQKSTDNGNSWETATYTGLNGSKKQDKEWCVIDRTNNNIYVTWTQFDGYRSTNPLDSSTILFSKSLDLGATWSEPKRINKHAGTCLDDDNTMEGAVPAVGPEGQIYVAWAGPNGIVFNRSEDEGETWLEEEILIDEMPGGWRLSIPGLMRANGFPIVKCDLSGGPNHGTIYVNWSDQRNGEDNTDIWLAKSTDQGNTWSAPIRVNDDESGRHQFFCWMDIDQTNGDLYTVFYDRRAYSDNQTDVYLARSTNGGESFVNRKISESPFIPDEEVFFGDYTNITVHNGIVRPIWARSFYGLLSVWTDITPAEEIFATIPKNQPKEEINFSNYPNPITTNQIFASFKLKNNALVSLYLRNQNGEIVHKIIEAENMEYGKHVIPCDLDQLNLPSGTYYHELKIDDNSKVLKTIVIN